MADVALSPRERLLEATFAVIARSGIGRATVEDVAREAGMARATVYRHFPGGRDELVAETIGWESRRFFARLAEAVAGSETIDELLERALLFAHRAIEDHAVLQRVLREEPDRLLPPLTVESHRILELIAAFLLPHVQREPVPPGTSPAEVATYLARMLLSFIGAQGRWDLTDRDQVAELVRTELLAWRR